MQIGAVSRLWRYPVKSMLGEECREVELQARGFHGDRLFAVEDAEGKLGSGKNTRGFRLIDGLLGLHARHAGEWPEIAFPDGRRLCGNDQQLHDALSAALGTRVALVREARVPHFSTTLRCIWSLQPRLSGCDCSCRRAASTSVASGRTLSWPSPATGIRSNRGSAGPCASAPTRR
jgi:hypothetical protein